MKIQFSHLGVIEQGCIELNDLTIFCGRNNTGKTYAMYSIYGLLAKIVPDFAFARDIVEHLRQHRFYTLNWDDLIASYLPAIQIEIAAALKHALPALFAVDQSSFDDTGIKITVDAEWLAECRKKIERSGFWIASETVGLDWSKDAGAVEFGLRLNETVANASKFADDRHRYDRWMQADLSKQIMGLLLKLEFDAMPVFLLSAEREGLNLFYKELTSVRMLALQLAQNDAVNREILLKSTLDARYPAPIHDYLQFLLKVDSNEPEQALSGHGQRIENDILNGCYKVDEFGAIFFRDSRSEHWLPLHFTSSTVKSLFGLVYFLKYLARKNSYLLIDEPELNLHPANQRQLARVLAELVNAGVKVMVSTHSDYFVAELNNLIMLKCDSAKAQALRKKYHYREQELLDINRVSAYLFADNGISEMKKLEEGIIADTFDQVIADLNASSDDIFYSLQAERAENADAA